MKNSGMWETRKINGGGGGIGNNFKILIINIEEKGPFVKLGYLVQLVSLPFQTIHGRKMMNWEGFGRKLQ
jgi:hypothetical protein